MAEKQKPSPALMKRLPIIWKHPETATKTEIRAMVGRLMDDQKNDPQPHKPSAAHRRYAKKK